MEIRSALESDLSRILEIYNASIPGRMATADLTPVSIEERWDWFHRHGPERPLFVCEVAGVVAGWFSFEDFYGRAAYLRTAELSLYIAPESQGVGLGRRLLSEALRIAEDIGVRNTVAFVFAHNIPSIRLLKRAGFERWGHLPGVAEMDGRDFDVLIMGKCLANPSGTPVPEA